MLGLPFVAFAPSLSRLCRAAAPGALGWGLARWLADQLPSRGLPYAETVFAGYRAALTSCGCLLVSYRTLAFVFAPLL